jgi:hypothetical protein
MIKYYLILAGIMFLISCTQDDLDFEQDKNRVISEFVRDTIYITDSVYIVEEKIIIDTLYETIRDTVYLNNQKDFKEVHIDGAISFSETYWDDYTQKFIKINHFYTERDVKSNFILDQDEDQKILHANIDFSRNNYNGANRDEWISKIQISTRYLNMNNVNYIHPFGWNLGLLHYFNVITLNKNEQYFSKLHANNLLKIEFENYYNFNRSKMKIEGLVLKNSAGGLYQEKDFIYFTLDIPLEIEEN